MSPNPDELQGKGSFDGSSRLRMVVKATRNVMNSAHMVIGARSSRNS